MLAISAVFVILPQGVIYTPFPPYYFDNMKRKQPKSPTPPPEV